MKAYPRPEFQLAQVIRNNRSKLEELKPLTAHQKAVLTCMENCRTPAMGGHLMACEKCGSTHYAFHSCRNRHCNICGGMKRDKWVKKRKDDMLAVKYFHMVFTLPHQLNDLCLKNQKILYDLLMKSAWQTLKQFGKDHKYLGADMGAVMVLHTWGQNLAYHNHVHCMVPAGGVTKQGKWRNAKLNGKFLAPVKQMSKVFRGKFTDGLINLHNLGKISMDTPFDKDRKYLHPLYKNKWVVFAKKQMLSANKVIDYIGRYVHKVAISNSRIKNYDGNTVTFSWFDYRTSKTQITPLDAVVFLKRFVLHILPKGFPKIRHYGILACRNKTQIIKNIREQMGVDIEPDETEKLNWIELYRKLYGKIPLLCKHCKQGILVIIEELPRARDGPIPLY
jgi:hypothetical protein